MSIYKQVNYYYYILPNVLVLKIEELPISYRQVYTVDKYD